MAIGDDALSASYPLVPNEGEEGKRKYGAREINRTRDFIAQVKKLIPVGRGGYRSATGLGSGPGTPQNIHGEDGDIYFKTLS